jgi:hypothetical protein
LIETERSSLPDGIDLTVELSRVYAEWQGGKGKHIAIGHLIDLSRLERLSGEDKREFPHKDKIQG